MKSCNLETIRDRLLLESDTLFGIYNFINIFFITEALDKRETEIMLIDGETIYALEKFAVIEAKWQEWSNQYNSLFKNSK